MPQINIHLSVQGNVLVMSIMLFGGALSVSVPFDLNGAESHLKAFAANVQQMKNEQRIVGAIIAPGNGVLSSR